MMIRSFSIVMLVWLCGLVQAQHDMTTPTCTDSLFLQIAGDGTVYLQWQVGSHTSLQEIFMMTDVSLAGFRSLNPILHFRNIEPCDRLLLPFQRMQIIFSGQEGTYPLYYRVRQGETMYGIAHRLLEVPVDTLLKLNNLSSCNLQPGQCLNVGYLFKNSDSIQGSWEDIWADNWRHVPGYVVDTQMVNVSPAKNYASQHGVAWWNKNMNDPNFFALHRKAPLNSLIEIRNPMFGRSVWAKVIGTIPPTYADDISVIVSPGVAKYLGAIDGRFYVEMNYEEGEEIVGNR